MKQETNFTSRISCLPWGISSFTFAICKDNSFRFALFPDNTIPMSATRRRSSLKDIVDYMADRMTAYDAVFKACKEIEMVGEDGKHIVVVQ